jgi:putative hydrolase of the HAD superfamily
MIHPAAILFDLDGTLTDRQRTMAVFADGVTSHFADTLRPPTDGTALRQHVFDALVAADGWGWTSRREFFKELVRRLPLRAPVSPEEIRSFWARHFAECTQPADGLHDALATLRTLGIRLGVVSNGGGEMQQRKLDVLGVRGAFDCIVISGVAGLTKPDPQIFRHATAAIGVAPETCWFVGDHPLHDVAGARVAGLSAVWVDHGQPWPTGQPPAERRIQRLTELPGLIR